MVLETIEYSYIYVDIITNYLQTAIFKIHVLRFYDKKVGQAFFIYWTFVFHHNPSSSFDRQRIYFKMEGYLLIDEILHVGSNFNQP